MELADDRRLARGRRPARRKGRGQRRDVIVLHCLVQAAPAAWITGDLPAVLAGLARWSSARSTAVATAAHRLGRPPGWPGPGGTGHPRAAPRLARPAAGQPSFNAVLFTDTAPLKLATLVWRTGTDLAGGLLAVLDRLRLARTPPRPRPR